MKAGDGAFETCEEEFAISAARGSEVRREGDVEVRGGNHQLLEEDREVSGEVLADGDCEAAARRC